MVEEIDRLRMQVVNDYWRKGYHINGLFKEFSERLNRQTIDEVLRKALDGREYIAQADSEKEVLQKFKESEEELKKAQEAFAGYFEENFEAILQRQDLNRYAQNFLIEINTSAETLRDGFYNKFEESRRPQYLDSFPEEEKLYKDIKRKQKQGMITLRIPAVLPAIEG